MISLPGLNLAAPPAEALSVPTASITRDQDLPANTEYRFEVGFSRTLTVRLRSGTAEYFGTELAPSTTYSFQGTKGAIYTWHGCKLELGGEVESDYVAEETPMMSHANLHFALEMLRDQSVASNNVDMGPRVLVVGTENAGKTALVKTLTSYAVKSGRQPLVINLDPRQGMLSVPGSFSAAAFSSIVDMEEGWGSSPISGPSPLPVKMPLVYHYGLKDPEESKLFKPLVTRMALAVTSRLEEDRVSRQAGFIIDTAGSISGGRGGVYDNIEHIVSEFSVNILITLGSERLYSDLCKRFSPQARTDEPVTVLRIDKSGGCVDRPEAYMVALRHAQIRAYFFGHGEDALAPSSMTADYADLNIFQIVQADDAAFQAGDYDPSTAGRELYERVSPSALLTNKLLVITTASPNDRHEVIRDSSVRGYIYVADVDEAKRKVRLLSPQPGHLPGNAMVLGTWPEDVAGLVS
ncbi:mRNA cleavage and polyadenylation factor IA/II complex [Didymella exigua CBS 183.55]|uniref:Polynucleotide 5'-hydroxyl-kinase GRC3 n=1 Tax=Didymella exigua CBS 183.55 TaxID=1150837 RepID=A0A6A5RAF2_9PLEO|nr:mRNA cleavage and polyadenylation factor IA/II complex [Didymella exigua CBS 183.55]KAF1924290.1 mRNA cleavage and polyadenylation factor IA/II complex [Didymella exigua CBS 183.55]